MSEFSEKEKLNNEEPKYTISENVQIWMAAYFIKMAADEITQEEYRVLQSEYENFAKENPEYKLAYLRRYEPESRDTYRLEQELVYEEKLRKHRAETEQAEKTPINPENNILTHYEDTLNRMAQIEGEGWKLGQEDDFKENSLKKAREALQKLKRKIRGWDFQVYGSGGFNRWCVRSDGSVEFSAWHASHLADEKVFGNRDRVIARVKLLGFKILE